MKWLEAGKRGRPEAVQTCYAGGGDRGRPGAYRLVTLMGLLWRPALAHPLGRRGAAGDGCGVGSQPGFSAPAGRPWNRIAAAQSQATGWQFPLGRRGSNASHN